MGGWTSAISLIRPPMVAGPMGRQARERMRSGVIGEASAGGVAGFFFGVAAVGPGRYHAPRTRANVSKRTMERGRTERRAPDDMVDLQMRQGAAKDRAVRARASTGRSRS